MDKQEDPIAIVITAQNGTAFNVTRNNHFKVSQFQGDTEVFIDFGQMNQWDLDRLVEYIQRLRVHLPKL